MECPYCGSELNYNDWYYRGNYSADAYEKLGDIYRCPNYQGFDDSEEAKNYVENNSLEIGIGKDFETLDKVCCTSAEWNGSFYTDQQDNLHEGYPC